MLALPHVGSRRGRLPAAQVPAQAEDGLEPMISEGFSSPADGGALRARPSRGPMAVAGAVVPQHMGPGCLGPALPARCCPGTSEPAAPDSSRRGGLSASLTLRGAEPGCA